MKKGLLFAGLMLWVCNAFALHISLAVNPGLFGYYEDKTVQQHVIKTKVTGLRYSYGVGFNARMETERDEPEMEDRYKANAFYTYIHDKDFTFKTNYRYDLNDIREHHAVDACLGYLPFLRTDSFCKKWHVAAGGVYSYSGPETETYMAALKLDFLTKKNKHQIFRVNTRFHMRSNFDDRMFEWWNEYELIVRMTEMVDMVFTYQLDHEFGFTEKEFMYVIKLTL